LSEENGTESKEENGLERKLDEITSLEEQLIGLKQKYVESVALASEDSVRSDEATFLLLMNRNTLYALPISFVVEVIQMAAIRQLPEEVWGVAGILDYHREMMAVVDFAELLGGQKSSIGADKALIICSVGSLRFAMMVDEATDVVTVAKDEIQVSEELLPGVLNALGMLRAGEQPAIIVDALSVALSIQLDAIDRDSIGNSQEDSREPGEGA
jgi:chemotaxis signal transduction protein